MLNLFIPTGRISNVRFAINYFLNIIVGILALLLGYFLNLYGEGNLLLFLVFLTFLVVQFVNIIKRFHDMNYSGWWVCVIAPIPVVNLLVIIYLFFARGTIGANRFGADPLG